MTSLLPPNLLRLFAPRPPLPFLKPLTRDERYRGPNRLRGITALVHQVREEADDDEVRQGMDVDGEPGTSKVNGDVKPAIATDPESKADKEAELKGRKAKRRNAKVKDDAISKLGVVGQEGIRMRREARKVRQEDYKKNAEKNYRPQDDPNAAGDPYKTLFISRLSKKATEADLRREFEIYGAIERVRIVRDRKGKSTAYAFIVYERERDMKAAYKDAEGIPIHHKRILVDVERGRTVKGWKPRRLGGGLGGRPKPVEPAAEAPPPQFSSPGGRGGFRGGFRGGPPGGGGFRGGFGGGRGGFGGGDRGGFGGGDRGGYGGGDRGGYGGGGDRGGGGGFRGGYGGPPGGGFGGRGGIGGGRGGYQGGGQDSGYGSRGPSGPPGGGYGGPPQSNGHGSQGGGSYGAPMGLKRDFDGPGSGGYGGGSGGYDGPDNKRPRY